MGEKEKLHTQTHNYYESNLSRLQINEKFMSFNTLLYCILCEENYKKNENLYED